MRNTVKEFSDLFSLVSRLIDCVSGALLRTLTAIVIIGKLFVKPVEIAIGILRDFEARREERRLKKAKRNESAMGSSSPFFVKGEHMKEKETAIMIRAKSPTIMHPERLDDMKAILREQIAEKYKCEEMISHTYEEGQSRIIRFYICRKGGLKNSLRYRLEKDLARMKRQWLPMTGYAVMIASGAKQ